MRQLSFLIDRPQGRLLHIGLNIGANAPEKFLESVLPEAEGSFIVIHIFVTLLCYVIRYTRAKNKDKG